MVVSWRMCREKRKLHSITIKNKYPIPIVDDPLDELRGNILEDLFQVGVQIRVKEEDIYKTA
jgi:hypothetical protein